MRAEDPRTRPWELQRRWRTDAIFKQQYDLYVQPKRNATSPDCNHAHRRAIQINAGRGINVSRRSRLRWMP